MSSLRCINKIRWNYTKEDECDYVVEIDNISEWSRRSKLNIEYPDRKLGKYTWGTFVQPYRANDFLSIHLFVKEALDQYKCEVDIDCTVSIINSSGDKTEGRRLVQGVKRQSMMSTQFSDLATMPRSSEVNDRLTLHFHVELFRLQKLFDEEEIHVSDSTLGKDFGGLLQSGDSVDIILTCQGVQFKAHKIILASRSSVFAAMFEHCKKDNEPSAVDMVDIVEMDADVLRQLLEYMYTDKANYFENLANGLLSAAYKFDLEHLRTTIEKSLAANLSCESAVNTLILAEKHSADQLRKVAVQFIKDHKADVMTSLGWIRNISRGPYAHLVAEFVD